MRFATAGSAMQPTPATSTHPRHGERGATLIVALIAVVALLGIGMVTMLTVRSDTVASGADRFQQVAMYAAESGAAAGVDFLRNNCSTSASSPLYSALVEPNNVAPQSPGSIVGNSQQPGQTQNPFTASPNTWYQVVVLNNPDDTGYVAGDDKDGVVILRSTGYGPNETRVTIELQVRLPECISTFCATEFAQKNQSSYNTAYAQACSTQAVQAGNGRTVQMGGAF